MVKKPLLFFTIFLSIVCFFSCSQPESEEQEIRKIEISAGAVANSDGTVSDYEPSDEDLKSLQVFSDKLRSIDKRFPGLEIDFKNIDDFFKVKQILNDYTLILENGERIGFAGCRCSRDFFTHLQITFSDKESHVYYVPSGYSESNVTYAYIWEVDLQIGDDNSPHKGPFGPAFSQLNETSMINKWCKPIEQKGHKYFERYVALSKTN